MENATRLKPLLILLACLLPFCLAYRDGARSESCYGHEIDHSQSNAPPALKQDCTGGCSFDLKLLGTVDPVSLEVTDAEVQFLECDETYKCKCLQKSCYLMKHSFALVSLTPAGSIGFLIQARSAPVFQRNSSIGGEWVQLDDSRYKPLGCRRNESTNNPTIYQVYNSCVEL